MTPLLINTGTVPNDKSADSLYSAFNKINANFAELYQFLDTVSLQETVQDYTALLFTTGIHSGITISYGDSQDRIDLTVLDQSWNQLLDKPFIPTDVNELTDADGLLDNQYTLPIATDSILGGIKVGGNLTIDQSGILSATDSNSITLGDNTPITPKDGDLWYDTTGGRLYVYFSNTWVDSNPGLVSTGVKSSDTAPVNPANNDLWYDTTGGRLYVYFSNTWVDSNPETQYPPPTRVTQSDTVPSNPVDGELWYDTVSGRIYVYYSSTWVDTNPDSTPQTLRFCLDSVRTLTTDETNPQSLFGVGVRLSENTRYEYTITGVVSKSSSNQIDIQYSLTGTTLSKHQYEVLSTESNSSLPQFTSNQLTSGFDTPVSISTGMLAQPTNYNFTITGIIDVVDTGNVNPMISFSGLPGDCSVLAGRIELTPLGSTGANTVIGPWSV